MLKFVSFLALVLCGSAVAEVLEPEVDFETDEGGVRIFELRVTNRLKCHASDDDAKIVWKRDGKSVTSLNTEDDPKRLGVEDNVLVIRRTVPADLDTYTCEINEDGKTVSKDIRTISKPIAKIIASPVSIEGEKLKLECQFFDQSNTSASALNNGVCKNV